MRVSSPSEMRWVIQNVHVATIRSVKALAAEHGLRICEVLDAVVGDAWEAYCANLPIGPRTKDVFNL